jgi:NAD(P)-dependent dehydrogenase (short-subunit alcohol dehydrogenase family)
MALLDGKRVVVTGASRGLGRAFALGLAGAGAAVVINGTNAELLEGVAEQIRTGGGTAVAVAGSVADDDVAGAIVARCVDELGGIDAVVNNAGIVRDRTLLKMTPEEFDEVVAVNLRGTWSVSRHAARAMKDAGGGLLLQVVSGSGFVGSVGQTNYAASKAGVLGMLYAWDVELRRFGIRVNALWPIATTDMTQVVFDLAEQRAAATGATVPTAAQLGFGRPEDVAPVVVYLCSDRAAHLRSQLIAFNGSKLAVWQHPREREVHRQEGWTIDELDAVLTHADEQVHVPER